MGSIIVPGSTFDSKVIEMQAGQLRKENGNWVELTGARNSHDDSGNLITANNGPFGGNEREIKPYRILCTQVPGCHSVGRYHR